MKNKSSKPAGVTHPKPVTPSSVERAVKKCEACKKRKATRFMGGDYGCCENKECERKLKNRISARLSRERKAEETRREAIARELQAKRMEMLDKQLNQYLQGYGKKRNFDMIKELNDELTQEKLKRQKLVHELEALKRNQVNLLPPMVDTDIPLLTDESPRSSPGPASVSGPQIQPAELCSPPRRIGCQALTARSDSNWRLSTPVVYSVRSSSSRTTPRRTRCSAPRSRSSCSRLPGPATSCSLRPVLEPLDQCPSLLQTTASQNLSTTQSSTNSPSTPCATPSLTPPTASRSSGVQPSQPALMPLPQLLLVILRIILIDVITRASRHQLRQLYLRRLFNSGISPTKEFTKRELWCMGKETEYG